MLRKKTIQWEKGIFFPAGSREAEKAAYAEIERLISRFTEELKSGSGVAGAL
jgi:hypothetical protein